MSWSVLRREGFPRPFVLPAYSEFMPAPWVGFKPYGEELDVMDGENGWIIDDDEVRPGLEKIAAKLGFPVTVILSLTQDDKGRVRWTLFGASDYGQDHAGFRKLAQELPGAMQIPLLQHFRRAERKYGIRIPQSGWLDEVPDVPRTHRWQKVRRDQDDVEYDDPATIALFSTDPDHLCLYGKPMARNAQIWTEDFRLFLDGPRATREELARAAKAFRAGGRYGYRMYYPPMRAGRREVFWYRPISPIQPGYLDAEGLRFEPRFRKRVVHAPSMEVTPVTYAKTATREFEEKYWRAIVELCAIPRKNNGDARPRGLETVEEYLRRHYAKLGLEVERHEFTWETEWDYPWLPGWGGTEANLIVKIPGKRRDEAVLMCDHYDTAYMEDAYYPSRGGTRMRESAAGADDNHSATAALMMAAEVLKELTLERDVWLVHLTGEEFPADCLGARALARDLIEGRIPTRVVGAYVLDMIAHNRGDVFQISPGEGGGAARLASIARAATAAWNRNPNRERSGRSQRVEGPEPPPPARFPVLDGQLRQEWEPKSSLYNTDGQIFSDVGIPVVLFMENYDISRTGYHDREDTMKNIDLDFGAAVAAIAIESVATAAH